MQSPKPLQSSDQLISLGEVNSIRSGKVHRDKQMRKNRILQIQFNQGSMQSPELLQSSGQLISLGEVN